MCLDHLAYAFTDDWWKLRKGWLRCSTEYSRDGVPSTLGEYRTITTQSQGMKRYVHSTQWVKEKSTPGHGKILQNLIPLFNIWITSFPWRSGSGDNKDWQCFNAIQMLATYVTAPFRGTVTSWSTQCKSYLRSDSMGNYESVGKYFLRCPIRFISINCVVI